MAFTNSRYETLRDLFKSQRLPLAFVDLDAFDSNVDYAAALAKKADKTLRLGTKSLRCLPLMERVLAHASLAFHACMEIDMAYRPLGNDWLHLGLRRSLIRTVEQALELVRFAKTLTHVKIDSIMSYEGHDPIFFQHAKAGELCERFNKLILIQGGNIIDKIKTYRGEGFAFL
jgi:D-serine deaminase-like pyridoxal phosphate-dependent protein